MTLPAATLTELAEAFDRTALNVQQQEIWQQFREQALLNEQRFLAVLASVSDAITLVDAHGVIVDANPAAGLLFGYPKSELIGKRLQQINPKLPDNHIENWLAQNPPGSVEVSESLNTDAFGRQFPVQVYSSAVRANGAFSVVAVARDISHLASQQQQLLDSESRFSELFEALDKGVMLHGSDGQLLAINPAGKEIFDMPDIVLSACDKAERLELYNDAGEFVEWKSSPLQRALLGERVESITIGIYAPKTFRFRWINASAIPRFKPGESAPFQVLTMFSDVTELKRDSEFFLQTQRLAGVGCWEFAVQARSVFWSFELYRMLGVDPQFAVDVNSAFEVVHPAEREALRRWWRTVLVNPQPFEREVRVLGIHGDVLWVRLNGKPQYRRGTLWRFLGTAQDISQIKGREEALTRQVQIDATTGFLNQESGAEMLVYRMAQAGEHQLGLLKVDFDRFNVISPLLGPALFVQLLSACAKRVQNAMPPGASFVRMHGDDFLVVVDVDNESRLWAMAEKLSQAFVRPFDFNEESFVLAPAIGVARYPEDGTNAQTLLKHVDAAMSEARSSKSWQSFSPGLALKLRQKVILEAQLRNALLRNEFYLVYQPKMHLRTGKMIGVEALLRWNNKVLGEIAPDQFIETAEATGDIVQIGAFVLDQALAQLREWRANGIMVAHVAINVSFRQFLSDRFDHSVADALAKHELPGNCLEIEMTERVLIKDIEETGATLAALRAQGVAIVIDDFGEGYSALGYLRRLQVDGVKISHHFMREIPASSVDRILCEAIISMARNLKLKVVAEGVETSAQADFLLRAGADVAQGFMFSAPLRADALADFLLTCGSN